MVEEARDDLQTWQQRGLKVLVNGHPLLGLVPEAHRNDLLRRFQIITLKPGDTLYEAGRPATDIFFVLEGALQIESPARGSSRGVVVLMLAAPGVLGECQALHQRTWSGTGVALFPTNVLPVEPQHLESLMLQFPRLAVAMYRELSWRFLMAIEFWKLQKEATPREALSRLLLSYRHVHRLASRDLSPALRVLHSELGRATGLRRETVSRLMGSFVKAGFVEKGPLRVSGVQENGLLQLLPSGRATLLVPPPPPGRVPPTQVPPTLPRKN